MTQDEVLNLDNRVAADVKASTQEREENRKKKQEEAEALCKEINHKRVKDELNLLKIGKSTHTCKVNNGICPRHRMT